VKPLTFQLTAKPPCRVDASPLLPTALAGKSRNELARLRLLGWNESYPAGELFAISGEDSTQVVLEGLEGSLVRVGAGLNGGELTVVGHAGDYAGESMRRGALVVRGSAGEYVGAGMRGGTLTVSGDVGAFAGSGRAGEVHGMAGGRIVVRGSAGDRAGDRMRRGLLLVEGNVGRYCAARMVAGTAVVLGSVGTHPGYLMRRGTLLLADRAVELLPTFNDNGRHRLLAIRLLLASLAQYGPGFRRFARRVEFARWLGDLGSEGMGEVLIAQ